MICELYEEKNPPLKFLVKYVFEKQSPLNKLVLYWVGTFAKNSW